MLQFRVEILKKEAKALQELTNVNIFYIFKNKIGAKVNITIHYCRVSEKICFTWSLELNQKPL